MTNGTRNSQSRFFNSDRILFFSIFMLRTNLEWQQVANLHVSVKASDAAEEYNPANLNGLSLFINPWFLCEVNEAVI